MLLNRSRQILAVLAVAATLASTLPRPAQALPVSDPREKLSHLEQALARNHRVVSVSALGSLGDNREWTRPGRHR